MPFNFKTFRTRTITSLVFAGVMIAGVFWNQWSFLFLFTIIHFGCWWEYFKLLEKIHNTSFHIYAKIGMMVMGYGILLWFCNPSLYNIRGYSLRDNLSLPVTIAAFTLLLIGIFSMKSIKLKAFLSVLCGLIYISLSFALMVDLAGENRDPHTGNILFSHHNIVFTGFIMFSLWMNDTMAYLVGSLFGKTPLIKISPKKTWEGTIGGILLTGVSCFILLSFRNIQLLDNAMNFALISMSLAIVGTFGDIFESKLKRMAGVKDSGSLMPGHGGFLDRFDSLLFAIPVAWLLLKPCLFGPC